MPDDVSKRVTQIIAEQAMLDPEVYTNGDKVRQLQQDRADEVGALGRLEAEWSRRADEV